MNIENTMKITKKGRVSVVEKTEIDRATWLDILRKKDAKVKDATIDSEMKQSGFKKEKIKGKLYYTITESRNYASVAKWYKNNPTFAHTTRLCETEMQAFVQSDDYIGRMKTYLGSATKGITETDWETFMDKSYFEQIIEFPYEVKSADSTAIRDKKNPKRVTWKCTFKELEKGRKIYAKCDTEIKVKKIVQGKAYNKAVKLNLQGVNKVLYRGKKISKKKRFTKQGRYNVILRSKKGQRRTLYFIIDKTKPKVAGVANKGKYKGIVTIGVTDALSGLKSVKLNGKLQETASSTQMIQCRKGTYTLIAKDWAGNTKKVQFKVTR